MKPLLEHVYELLNTYKESELAQIFRFVSFKNLFLITKMRNVAGLSTSEAQKSSDLFVKCRFMDEEAAGAIFCTHPLIRKEITNSAENERLLRVQKARRG